MEKEKINSKGDQNVYKSEKIIDNLERTLESN